MAIKPRTKAIKVVVSGKTYKEPTAWQTRGNQQPYGFGRSCQYRGLVIVMQIQFPIILYAPCCAANVIPDALEALANLAKSLLVRRTGAVRNHL